MQITSAVRGSSQSVHKFVPRGHNLAPAALTRIALVTSGKDRHYIIGLLEALVRRNVMVDCLGGDEVADAPVLQSAKINFYNFIGSQSGKRALMEKMFGFLAYYLRFMSYAARTDVRIFHIQWFRKFPRLERVLLTVFLKFLGKRIVFTAHNVDAEARDGRSGILNRLSLWFLYHAVDHILVHTTIMKTELVAQFRVAVGKVTVVPFGSNSVIPQSILTRTRAKQELGLEPDHKIVLFFGTIVAYKGIEDLLEAMAHLVRRDKRFRLIIAGPVWAAGRAYWRQLEQKIDALGIGTYVKKEVRTVYLPDSDVSLFFKASDVSVLPYKKIYQSGVVALSYQQGLPVVAARVGPFEEDVMEGKTGLLFRPGDAADLAEKISMYFESKLYFEVEHNSSRIREYGFERFSWDRNADYSAEIYQSLQCPN